MNLNLASKCQQRSSFLTMFLVLFVNWTQDSMIEFDWLKFSRPFPIGHVEHIKEVHLDTPLSFRMSLTCIILGIFLSVAAASSSSESDIGNK